MLRTCLLDTQVLVLAYLSPTALPARVRQILEDPGIDRILSAVSIVEIGIKSALGKLQITEQQLQVAVRDLVVQVVPFAPEHAMRLFRLPQRTDMFDRMLVATALSLDIPILSGDREFSLYKGLDVIWK